MKAHCIISLLCFLGLQLSAGAEDIKVTSVRYYGPHAIGTPVIIDSVDVHSKKFDVNSFLDAPLPLKQLSEAVPGALEGIKGTDAEYSQHFAGFTFQNSGYAAVSIKVDGLKRFKLFVDGKAANGELKLSPAAHQVVVSFITGKDEEAQPSITLKTAQPEKISFREDGLHPYGMKDVLLGTRFSDVSVSPKGDYMTVSTSTTAEGGSSTTQTRILRTADGSLVTQISGRASWMPVSDRYWFTRRDGGRTQIVTVDPATGEEEIFADNLPSGSFSIAPTEDFLIYSMYESAPGEKAEIYEILNPEDRQQGWRSRSYPARYDIATGLMRRLAFGFHDSRITDISADGRTALMSVYESVFTQRPTSVSTLYLLDFETMETKLLVDKDGFMGGAWFSPDGKSILLSGSPEAFGGIGMNVRDGQTPSLQDTQLYIMDLASGKIRPMTRNFDPNVQTVRWNRGDGKIYFTAENKDFISLYRMTPKNGKIEQLDVPEDLVNRFSIAADAPVLAWYGQSASNSDRLYTMDTKTGRNTLRRDLSADILADVDLGECHEWNFKNSKGETVYGRYYLPPHFDASRKYPMIVNYYGGCSPTSRNFESRYPHHAYAALGYVVYVVAGPSGATGFGQEWSARHVNTAGEGPAQDIIEGTMQFCKEHPFVNEKKVGCIGASYGGFMSQYIPTLTDFFACSVSHAGISDHTSYWGFGYWGYSYSETSMANSYPWSDRELYVDRSPLYRADKINTPILFIHGDADTNVPVNESVQMFTALKLLGKETAFVAVKDQNHHILDYNKRLQWQDTIWAWFAKWLQDDPLWWDTLYPPKSL